MTRRELIAGAAALSLPAGGARGGDDLSVLAAKIAPRGSDDARAAALHDFVRDEIRFGWAPRFNRHDAADTLRRRIGFCQTKGLVMRDLLRASGVEARLIWAEIDATVLRGLIDTGTPRLDHAYVEARIGGVWTAFDSYVVDAPLGAGAAAKLRGDGARVGYGVHAEGGGVFPDFIQFRDELKGRVWGAFETPEDFEAEAPKTWSRLPGLVRAAFGFFAAPANARADAIRTL